MITLTKRGGGNVVVNPEKIISIDIDSVTEFVCITVDHKENEIEVFESHVEVVRKVLDYKLLIDGD